MKYLITGLFLALSAAHAEFAIDTTEVLSMIAIATTAVIGLSVAALGARWVKRVIGS